MRVAWFSPWPPERSGIAVCSADLVPALCREGWGVDVFVDAGNVPVPPSGSAPPMPGVYRLQSAHDFVWRVARHKYDVTVYQLGNSTVHDFIWPYVFRWPGVAVLHETRLHHARAHALLSRRQVAEYRAEFAWNQPSVPPDAAELGVMGLAGTYYYLWPMVRRIVESSRLTATHTPGAAAELRAAYPSHAIDQIALGHGRVAPVDAAACAALRARLGIRKSEVLIGVFGGLSAEKRVPQILRAFAHSARRRPDVRLLLAGAPDGAVDIVAMVHALGIADRVTLAPSLDDEDFDLAVAAADICVNLRWPTAVEVSGPWLRALAAGRPTITLELVHQTHVPALDPRTWQPLNPESGDAPVTVAVDLLDEEHSLRLALDRLTNDTDLCAMLGRAGRAYWEREHSPARMVTDYVRVVTKAALMPDPTPSPGLPDTDPLSLTRALLSPFGEVPCELR